MAAPKSTPAPPGSTLLDGKWGTEEISRHYAAGRFRNRRAAGRDPRAVRALLARFEADPAAAVLDAPCGTGRLTAALAPSSAALAGGCGAAYVGLDVSAAMLSRAREAAPGARFVQGSALCLPFRDSSFENVVCCRLLHHLADEASLVRAVGELVRVSSRLVVASFWDAGSLHAMRRRLGLRRGRPDTRVAIDRSLLARHFERAGAPVLAFRHGLRFVTQQTFLVARKA